MNDYIKGMLKDTFILFIITLAAGLILGVVYQVTKEPIAAQKEKVRQEACKEVFSEAETFETVQTAQAEDGWVLQKGELGFEAVDIDEVMKASDAEHNMLGYVITVTDHEGYSGDIQFMLGIRSDGTLNGISILSISETAGLGMRAEEVLKPQFEGKKVEVFEYTKTEARGENQIDAISGATITTNAVTNGVNAGLNYFRTVLKDIPVKDRNSMEGGSGNE
ncbi:electron transport complex protein RnfG [Kineothrix alysoides]|uniref:Ion-translocating oxidoreductase complex subunit G n=1 Tax=Kineothrix alysoides TaxID=1469948 RepID=A0A4R1R3H2_9FIRM|nr:RnfABCDGE type electron transport complex subunit G [Kineothrix alysoides]TCL59949.1 electron transport complex protein RnfG [Kineothrix alysoides]